MTALARTAGALGCLALVLAACGSEGGSGAAGGGGGAAGSGGEATGGSGGAPGGSGGHGGAGGGEAGSGGGAGTGPVPFPLPAVEHDHGDPTDLEQTLLERIQRMRADPAAEADLVLAVPEAQNAITFYGVDPDQVRAEFATYPASPPLAFDGRLIAAARAHSQDMLDNDFQGHDGTDGSDAGVRIKREGYVPALWAENVFARVKSVDYAHAAFAIDWGVPSLGHRFNLLDLASDGMTVRRRRHVGLGIVEGSNGSVGPLVVTENFANEAQNAKVYLVGVAYDDLDGDESYDPAEGVPGLAVVPDRGDTWARTSTSGGYAIPFDPGAGEIRVQLQRDGVVIDEAARTVGADGVKLDFVITR